MLASLTQERILDISRKFGIGLRGGRVTKKRLAAKLGVLMHDRLPAMLDELGRDELRAACRAHGLPDTGLARRDLQARLLRAAGFETAQPLAPPDAGGLPRRGQMVLARHRQWLVEDTIPAPAASPRW